MLKANGVVGDVDGELNEDPDNDKLVLKKKKKCPAKLADIFLGSFEVCQEKGTKKDCRKVSFLIHDVESSSFNSGSSQKLWKMLGLWQLSRCSQYWSSWQVTQSKCWWFFKCLLSDGDLVGDACDLCPDVKDFDQKDSDGDGYLKELKTLFLSFTFQDRRRMWQRYGQWWY